MINSAGNITSNLNYRSETLSSTAERPSVSREEQRLRQSCKDLELIFINQMLSAMRKSVPQTGMFTSDKEEYFQDQLYEHYAQGISESTTIGLADRIYFEMSQGMNQHQV